MSPDNIYKVIIATSGDIFVEGKIVTEVCNGMNANLVSNDRGINYEINRWADVFTSPLSPAEIVMKLEKECDVLVCIFHKRFGSTSVPGKFCNLHTFLSSYDLWKELKKPYMLFFFKEVTVTSLQDMIDPQLIKVFELKERIKSDNSISIDDFKAPGEFCEKVQDRLDSWSAEHGETQ